MRCNGFSLRRKTTAQKDPERLIDKFILHISLARRLSINYEYSPSSIIAMDETSVSNDTVSYTTIDKQEAKSVCLKTTGYEKCMFCVCLAATEAYGKWNQIETIRCFPCSQKRI